LAVKKTIVMEKIFVVPKLACVLMSVQQLNSKGVNVLFGGKMVALSRNDVVAA
jgi:hypothetical protein